MRWLAGLIVLCLAQSGNCLSIGDYERQRDSSNTAGFKYTKTYLTGVAAGFIWANASNSAKKIPLLFCQPPPVTVEIDIARLLDEEIGQINVTDDYPAEAILLQALIRAYPCDSQPGASVH